MIKGFSLQSGESILARTRKHWVMLVRDLCGTIAVGIAPFVLLGLLSIADVNQLQDRVFLHILAFGETIWIFLIWLAFFALWTNYYLDIWIITNYRIANVNQINLFRRVVTTWQFKNIQEVTTEIQNPLQSLLDYGLIRIRTAAPKDNETRIEGIPHPDRIAAVIVAEMEQLRKLEQANKEQLELLHALSHEVKAHLTKDEAALAAIVEGDAGSVPDNLKQVAGNALAETRKGVAMVMNMLSGADLKAGTMKLDSARFDFAALVRDAFASVKKSAEEKGLSISCTIAPDAYGTEGDAAKLRDHVVRNIVDNAIHYTAHGFIRIALTRDRETITLTITDSGIGISKYDLQKLFTEGGMGAHALAANPSSTGFGLSIAKRIVEAHGGKIWAESPGEGRGSTFFVSLPATEPSRNSEAARAQT